jgi:hypothetical protein
MSETMRPDSPGGPPAQGQPAGGLARHLCQVVGLNQNFTSRAGTLYHLQIEDRGPVMDAVREKEVRRVNVIVYANYGEPNARIIFGRDQDFEDVRTQEHNRFIQAQIAQLAREAREVVEEKEKRRVERIKAAIRAYHRTKDEAARRALEEANALFPFVFSRAWMELKQEKGRSGAAGEPAPAAGPEVAPPPEAEPAAPAEVVYPLDPGLRERVLEIERIVEELGRDLDRLRARGSADDILLQTCRKLVTRARESICSREATDFTAKRLEMTRNSLMTTWRQVQSRLR